MARVEIRPSGGHTYAVVVEDVPDANGIWRKQLIQSFGNASKPENLAKAEQFAAAINAGRSFMDVKREYDAEQLKEWLAILAGTTLAAAAIAWLLKR